MFNRCCVCGAKRKDVKLHQFTTSETGLQKWLKYVNSDRLRSLSLRELRKSFVCHKHFEKKFITSRHRLRYGAYPTLFTEEEMTSGIPAFLHDETENVDQAKIDHTYARKKLLHEEHTYGKSESLQHLFHGTSVVTGLVSDVPSTSRLFTTIQNPTELELDVVNISAPTTTTQVMQHSPTDMVDITVSTTITENVMQHSTTETENIATVSTPKKSRRRLVRRVQDLTPNCKRLYKEFILSQRQLNFNIRAKRAIRISKNNNFEKLTSKMNTMAKKIFWMQISQSSKKIKARRFSTEEKMIALAIMKQSPKAYRFLQKIFILPSKNTLNKMISSFNIQPGVNTPIFNAIKEEVSTWSENKKYCSIIFDEMSLEPGLTYDKTKDNINGFVELVDKTNQFADHALSFMLRGAVHKWQQPISFYFCEGATKREPLKVIIQKTVEAVIRTGLLPVAIISDQGSSFQAALNLLIEDSRRKLLYTGENTDDVTITIGGQKLVVIYDPPHLIKGIRNNFLTKNIKDNDKISKWSDIVDVYKTDCGHAQARILHKLNDQHVIPEKISKMKVKNCTRVLSKTVAAALSYTSQFCEYF